MYVAYPHLAVFKAKVRVLYPLLPSTRDSGKKFVRWRRPDPFETLAKLSGFENYSQVVESDARSPTSPVAINDLAACLLTLLPTLTKEASEAIIEKLNLPTPDTLFVGAKPEAAAEPTWTTPPKHFYRDAMGTAPEIDVAAANGHSVNEILRVVDRITANLKDFHDGLFLAISAVIWRAIERPRCSITSEQGRPKLTRRAWPDLNGITFAELLKEPRPKGRGQRNLSKFPTYSDDFQAILRNAASDFVSDAVYALQKPASPEMPESLLAVAAQYTEDALTGYLRDQAVRSKGARSVWSLVQRRPGKKTGLIQHINTRQDFSLDERGYEGRSEGGLNLTRVHRPLPDGLVASIAAYYSYNEYEEEFDTIQIDLVVRTPSGDNVGFVGGRAYCAKDEGASAWDFFCVADSLDQGAADMAHMLLRGDVSKDSIFDEGNLLHVTGWEMAVPYQGQGLGAEAMLAFLTRANEVIYNLSEIYIDITPYQFPGIPPDKMPRQYARAQQAAKYKLDDYVENLCLADDLFALRDGDVIAVWTNPVDSERTPEEGEALMARYLSEMQKRYPDIQGPAHGWI